MREIETVESFEIRARWIVSHWEYKSVERN